jgi:hypothetical protein
MCDEKYINISARKPKGEIRRGKKPGSDVRRILGSKYMVRGYR